MKATLKISVIILFIILIQSCKKENPTPPTVTTASVSEISYTTATSGGEATSEGSSPIISKGICWNTSPNPTISNNVTIEGAGLGSFTSHLTQLASNTMYYIRAYATSNDGTGYGEQVSFTTRLIMMPDITTTDITSIAQTTAISGGNITADNGGEITERGVCWSTEQNPTISDSKTSDGSGTGSYTSNVSSLTGNTTYYLRAYATNSAGTQYGNQVTFLTSPVIPSLSTFSLVSYTTSSCVVSGSVTNDGGSQVTERGVCFSTSQNPTIDDNKISNGADTGAFLGDVEGLSTNITYYIKAFATNSEGTQYGDEIMFTTLNPITDIDGNIYNIAAIGTQLWMAENLKTTKYSDGTDIPYVESQSEWNAFTPDSQAYCWYNNDVSNKDIYGALYTWKAAMKGASGFNTDPGNIQGACPTGWHIPSNAEWTTLENYIGGPSVNAPKLKEQGTTHWQSPNDGTNETSFTGLPGGYRTTFGTFFNIGTHGYWWTSSDYGSSNAMYRELYSGTNVGQGTSLNFRGYSVRCIKDN